MFPDPRCVEIRGGRWLAVATRVACSAILWALGCGLRLPPRAAPASPQSSPEGAIVALGDTQRTTWAEEIFLGREQNEAARRALIQKIVREERPAFVVHLGDMVAAGSPDHWEYFDRLISPLEARQIRIFPVLGNHDHWGGQRALRYARRRFPELQSGGFYARKHRALGLVWLDSNLEGDAGVQQIAWLERTLAEYEEDADVRGVVLFLHHPAYTNGKNRHGEPYVRNQVLPKFFAASKTRVMMSGHVHGYERFVSQGRTLVISGGGGGARVEYALGSDAPYVPAYITPTGDPRPFNYVVMDPGATGLRFTVKCLPHGTACRDGILERFTTDFGSSN